MDVRFERVEATAAPVLENLFEHYLYDMAEWFGFDTHEDGLYHYPAQASWEDGREMHFAYAGALPVGFARVGSAADWIGDPAARDLQEFFVMRRYRRQGLGRAFATHVFGCYPGAWLVRVFRGNRPALPFWREAISAYTGGELAEAERTVDDKVWSFFTFVSRPPS